MTEPLHDGYALVDKDLDWTSHDVVAKVRGILRTKKVGHAGTLDPTATGLLVLGVGRGTRLLRFVTALEKRYVGVLVLGTETTTLDAAGDVVARHDMAEVTFEQVEAAAARFVGEIQQIPPMVSAVKVEGRRLHELAREGKEVERAPRAVTIHDLRVRPLGPGRFELSVGCSSGTYIRTLAADIGHALGGGAHLDALRRVAVGSFTVDEATPVEHVRVRPLAEMVRDYPTVGVDSDVATAVGHGKKLDRRSYGFEGPGPWAVLDTSGNLLAMYEARGEEAKPSVVVRPA